MSDQVSMPAVGDDDDNVPQEPVRDLSEPDRRLEGWGGNDDAPELSDEQAAALQEREEPAAVFDFGTAFSADNAAVAPEADAPQTVEADTSLGHEGDERYQDHERGMA